MRLGNECWGVRYEMGVENTRKRLGMTVLG